MTHYSHFNFKLTEKEIEQLKVKIHEIERLHKWENLKKIERELRELERKERLSTTSTYIEHYGTPDTYPPMFFIREGKIAEKKKKPKPKHTQPFWTNNWR